MPRKRPMPPSEKTICRRLRTFRVWTGLSQAEFCALAGLNQRAYASYEYGRSQLNYAAAWRIFHAFGILNPIWLAEGTGKMIEARHFIFPSPNEAGIGARTLFSNAYQNQFREPLHRASVLHLLNPADKLQLFNFDTSAQGRIFSKDKFGSYLSAWIAERPDSHVNTFITEVFRRAAQVAARYPRDPDKSAIEKRLRDAEEIEMARKFPKRVLTDTESESRTKDVKPILPDLLARLRKATEEPGKRSELAKFLDAPLASVSRWLSPDPKVAREPGGEIALKMLHWVEVQERKQ